MKSKACWASALVLVAAACGDKPADGAGGGDAKAPAGAIKLGVAGPKTGKEAKNGQDLIEGTTLAVEEWNKNGGVLGRQIQVVVRDDEALDKNATAVASELVDEKVAGVVGHFNSGCTDPASLIYDEAHVPMITPASTNVKITQKGYKGVFRVCGQDDQQGRTAAEFVAGTLKLKKIAILDDRTEYGKGLADLFEKHLGGRVEVVLHDGVDKDSDNFRPYLTKIKESGAELVYFGGIYHQAVPLIRQARDAGMAMPFMSGDGVHGYPVDFIEKLGSLAEGTFTTFPNVEAAPGYAAFAKKYRDRFKTESGPYAIYSYAAANILLQSIEKAGTTDGVKVAEAIHAGSFDTPAGRIQFDAKGDIKALDYYTVWVIRGGKHVLYGSK